MVVVVSEATEVTRFFLPPPAVRDWLQPAQRKNKKETKVGQNSRSYPALYLLSTGNAVSPLLNIPE